MAPRRGGQQQNTLSPPEATTPSPSSPASYRSASPSNGFTNLFSKPTKWFNRSNSGGVGRASISSTEPRSSTSSTRKHKISHPTDPRPIMDNLLPPDRGGLAGASRSVMDLSLARTTSAMPDSRPEANRTPSSPPPPGFSRGLGDLHFRLRLLSPTNANRHDPPPEDQDLPKRQREQQYRRLAIPVAIAICILAQHELPVPEHLCGGFFPSQEHAARPTIIQCLPDHASTHACLVDLFSRSFTLTLVYSPPPLQALSAEG
ncbi:hypothetical protein NUW54_g8952 [Trametes sanguinea]|uniref:Uncharacterized protein n=1 Tax=Trametes sanguinea TaxID=158606 RepID=A0ACC1PC89_9APHY|nr:hypothetical protein NUW54_g8952 [Trametes sanguinea]